MALSQTIAPEGARGELRRLLKDLSTWSGPKEVLEVLIEGPRGSAKSHGFSRFLFNCCVDYPGCKILVIRKTRESLTNSFCKTFEEDIVPDKWKESILGSGDRTNRSHYIIKGSRIVLGGLDKPSKHQSTDWDIVVVEEGSEVRWKQVEPFFGAIRQWTRGIPWQLFACLTNPDAPSNWQNQRAKSGKMRRVVTYHKDNPKWYTRDGEITEEGAAFMKSLDRYTGVERDRHVLGLWRGAEGMVWDNFNEELHVVERPQDPKSTFGIKGYFAACDWGWAHAGSMSVYGHTYDNRLVRVAQAYHTGKMVNWWADWAVKFVEMYELSRIVCDPSQPQAIETFNECLRRAGKPQIAFPANNKKASGSGGDLGGLDLVRWALEPDENGLPKLIFLEGSLVHPPDPELVMASRPTCTEEEIPSYVLDRDATGEFIKDQTDKRCQDDGCDDLRYACTSIFLEPVPEPKPRVQKVDPWTNAAMFGTPASLAREANRRARQKDW